MVDMLVGESFGDYFRRVRKSKGFKSQKDLATASNGKVSQATLSRIEDNQQKPFPETLKVLAETLDEPYEKLMIAAGYIEGKVTHHPLRFNSKGELLEMTDEEVIDETISDREYFVKSALDEKIRETRENDSLPYGEKKIVLHELEKVKEEYRYPNFANSRDIKDLSKFLEQSEIMFDGVPMNDEEKARIRGFMESMFWDAKQKNKRKKNTEE